MACRVRLIRCGQRRRRADIYAEALNWPTKVGVKGLVWPTIDAQYSRSSRATPFLSLPNGPRVINLVQPCTCYELDRAHTAHAVCLPASLLKAWCDVPLLCPWAGWGCWGVP